MKFLSVILLGLALCPFALAKKKDADPVPCTKNISFSALNPTNRQVRPYMAGWIENWIRKNTEKHPGVCFNQQPQPNLTNYVIVLSNTPARFTGVQIVHSTDTTTTPVSGSGTVYGGGETWTYTYEGTVTTTTTTTEAVPYQINENTIYAVAYDANGGIVGVGQHLYSTQEGGDSNQAFGHNLGNALRAINARGRMLTGVVESVEKGNVIASQPAMTMDKIVEFENDYFRKEKVVGYAEATGTTLTVHSERASAMRFHMVLANKQAMDAMRAAGVQTYVYTNDADQRYVYDVTNNVEVPQEKK